MILVEFSILFIFILKNNLILCEYYSFVEILILIFYIIILTLLNYIEVQLLKFNFN